jgi:hypothetical protein
MRRNAPLIEFDAKLIERQVAVLGKAIAEPFMLVGKLTASRRSPLGFGFEQARLIMKDHQIIHETGRHPEMAGCRAIGMSFQNKRYNSLTQRYRMRFAHVRAPWLLQRRITHRLIWES